MHPRKLTASLSRQLSNKDERSLHKQTVIRLEWRRHNFTRHNLPEHNLSETFCSIQVIRYNSSGTSYPDLTFLIGFSTPYRTCSKELFCHSHYIDLIWKISFCCFHCIVLIDRSHCSSHYSFSLFVTFITFSLFKTTQFTILLQMFSFYYLQQIVLMKLLAFQVSFSYHPPLFDLLFSFSILI